jgi:hypothetical protein
MLAYKCEYEDGENLIFNVVPKEGLLFMCDILGFKNIIEENNEVTSDKIIVDLICFLEKLVKIQLPKFKEHKTLKNKIKDDDIKNYKLNYALVSDTFLVYPNIDYNIDNAMYYVSFQLLTVIAAAIFNECLSKHNILIRGTIVDGKYRILDEYNIIYGKAITEAYEIEQMQQWGGVLLSPSVLRTIKTNLFIYNNYKEYSDFILKQGYIYNKYKLERDKHSKNSIALNWIKVGKDLDKDMNQYLKPNWSLLFKNAEQIEDSIIKESALLKIKNTRKFYEDVVNNRR